MRSSKSRSRSKQNRPRSIGNIINRVFDSSGPEGKVRGTPQQIIEKYLVLARDAQLSNDRVAAENFMQHAEHYTRMLGEAQREMAAEQEARRNNGQNGQGGEHRGYPPRVRDDREEDTAERSEGMVPVLPFEDEPEGDSGLVETPESQPRAARQEPRQDPRPEPEPRTERPESRPEPRPEAKPDPAPRSRGGERRSEPSRRSTPAPAEPAAAPAAPEGEAADKPARSRRPRKPKEAASAPSKDAAAE
ncbi:DUF4167 domain-containing protein [Ruixingdingia sedimenti]|uniref:DUF4167 domain-containing protein n=1 Tax=Ruixingdingia sedimenti TaxID=3073604 RepID=A0ABU1F7X6_9RHOB|nr:DUF4167 domain-containing protein [Xinfangfangia sp. LG-4]MDR5652975.1 DUF4167 domain-containing protein [Xinfangfangia sp. LG-4]